MSSAGALAGARILVTRPQAQSAALCQAIAAEGGIALRLPLFETVADAPAEHLRCRLEAVRAARAWLFTSANAARIAHAAWKDDWPVPVAAVGAATAAALAVGTRAAVPYPRSGFSGADLAALPALHITPGSRFAVITGAGGRDELAAGLRARGARVDTVIVYRREPVAHEDEVVAARIRDAGAIVFTSADGVDRLLALVPPARRAQLLGRQLVLPSPRVVEHVRTLGFRLPPLLAERVADPAFVAALASWWQTRSTLADSPDP